jgi:hypothetical protein
VLETSVLCLSSVTICDQTTHMSKPAATKKAPEGESFARASAMTDSQYVLLCV